MTWRRTVASAFTGFALLLGGMVSASSTAAAPTFSDVPSGTPFAQEIEWLASQAISTGYADGTFRPHQPITRDAMAAFMYRLAGKPAFTPPARSPFRDVTPRTQFYKEITWLAKTGISTGYADGTYRPFEPVKRDAMAAFMYRLAGKPTFTAPRWSPFTDISPSSKFYKEMTWLAQTGISRGWSSNNTYRPLSNITRDAMAAFMYRLDRQIEEGGSGEGVVSRNGTSVVVGDGTPASCTSAAVASAVLGGGDVSFDCGPAALTIQLNQTLMTCNTHNCEHPWRGGDPVAALTVDGGGVITLSGGGSRGIFYANSCEETFGWLSSSCQNETTPHVTFRNIGFTDGNATVSPAGVDTLPGGGGGGAIAMRGGTLTVQDAWFTSNRCMTAHSDAGGGAIRATGVGGGVTISNSRFSDNRCANGGAVSSLQSRMSIADSTFTGNVATGQGASDGRGGNGGAVYFDGTNQNVTIARSTITSNMAPEGGPAVFYVSNNPTGSLTIQDSTLTGNTGQSFYTSPYRSIFFKGNTLTVSGGDVT
ncbi:S-layer homology domain-containing protein [Demequina sp. NBRC 110053]|uniref:S-layer homology domain-containing protein n=1 Tax=Demequina sp. NBRC 110053 TaxID=1570342 RepID=UPI0009FDE061|nr:S-layer homology domain-containing protein [Demequina sp. NBRC 110053]